MTLTVCACLPIDCWGCNFCECTPMKAHESPTSPAAGHTTTAETLGSRIMPVQFYLDHTRQGFQFAYDGLEKTGFRRI